MRFLDDLVNKAFQPDQDGRRLYYPWPLGRGYIVPSEAEFQRIRKNLKIFCVIAFLWFLGLLPLIPVISSQGDLRGAILGVYFFMPFEIWLYFQCRHLKRADEGLMFHERIVKRAAKVPIHLLLVYEIVSVGFVVAGILIIRIDWRHWLYSLASMVAIGFFGFRGVIAAKMIVAKRQQGNGNS
jgi:hypothetical protein